VTGAKPRINLPASLPTIADSLRVAEEFLQVRADRLDQMRRNLDAEVQRLDRVRQEVEALLSFTETGVFNPKVFAANRDALSASGGGAVTLTAV
jgi:hypothetical protein